MVKKIGIIGAGAFGTALAKVVADKGIEVTMWSFDKEGCDQINTITGHKKCLAVIICLVS